MIELLRRNVGEVTTSAKVGVVALLGQLFPASTPAVVAAQYVLAMKLTRQLNGVRLA